ncbi:DedA family protein [Leucobacter sp. CSA2]|uniref:DedA family protein n=1 Tax=Leucobacter edaphi TaxID=2796472 RepID=A0A934UX26_9MICO|nr:DedA family protein [Leucobacter edaphi]
MTDLLQHLIEIVRDLDPVLRTIIAGIGIMLETSIFIGLVVPGDTVALVAAVGVTGPGEFVALVAALIIGALIGESVGFLLGRWFGPRLRASRLGRRLGEEKWRVAEHYLGERGGVAVFLSRFLPVFHSLIPLTAGMAGMRYRRFISWTAPASCIWAIVVVSLGSGTAMGLDQLAGRVKGAGFIVIGVVVAVVVTLWLLKRLLLKREQRHLSVRPEVEAAPEEAAAAPAPATDAAAIHGQDHSAGADPAATDPNSGGTPTGPSDSRAATP